MALKDKTVAILVSENSVPDEFRVMQQRLADAGAEVIAVGPTLEAIERLVVDKDMDLAAGMGLECARSIWFDALVIPGGWSLDELRGQDDALEFITRFDIDRKPIAAIGRGVLALAAADALQGRKVSALPSFEKQLEQAGARLERAAFVEDDMLLTARGAESACLMARALQEVLERRHLSARDMESPITD